MQIRYLEIVTPDVDDVCAGYAAATGADFGSPEAGLGNARTAPRALATVGIAVPGPRLVDTN